MPALAGTSRTSGKAGGRKRHLPGAYENILARGKTKSRLVGRGLDLGENGPPLRHRQDAIRVLHETNLQSRSNPLSQPLPLGIGRRSPEEPAPAEHHGNRDGLRIFNQPTLRQNLPSALQMHTPNLSMRNAVSGAGLIFP